MAERRQATRRKPIEVEVEDGRVFTAHPLPWMQANDLGSEIVNQNLENANQLVRMWISDEGLPQLQMQFQKKISNWQSILRMAFPEVSDEMWTTPRVLDESECAELMLAALDVNHLEHIKHLIDPNSPTPTIPGGKSISLEPEGNGAKIESTADLDSQDSQESTPLS
jgi:hypothetical protein